MMEYKLAEFTANHSFERMSKESIHIIKRNILDSYAGICASLLDKEMLQKFERFAGLVENDNGISVWGINRKAQSSEALFMNTILGRRSDLVNTYMSVNNMGGSHPSDNVSLVLSLADFLGKNGKDVLASTYLAYQLSCAFADYYDPQSSDFDHDAQVLFFIPLVIAYMMGHSINELIEAQRIAGMLGLTIDQSGVGDITDWRHCTFASCAMRGMQAVQLSHAGFRGATDIYEGEAGINHFLHHDQSILEPLPDLGSVIFKQWPALVFCQTPIDVAIEVGKQIYDPASIQKIEVYIYKKAIEVGATSSSYKPSSRAGRTHSIPYCVAAAIVKKNIKYEYFDNDFIEKETFIASLIPSVKVIEDTSMTQIYPQGAPCRIVTYLKDGSTAVYQKDYPHGDPKDPLSDQEIEEKVYNYLSPITGRDDARNIIEKIWNMEKETSIEWLTEPLKKRII
jgi:2-methylcitrate dehydratase